jgi:hypothetical protein
MMDQGVKITPLPQIILKQDEQEASDFFGKTAYYKPQTMELVLYTLARHPKDVCRSFTHEMIHHIQNLEGRLGGINTSNVNEDQYLQEIEQEASLRGNMYFRSWEDQVKNQHTQQPVMAEGKYDKLSNTISSQIFTAWKQGFADGQMVVQFEETYEALGDVISVNANLLLVQGYGKMEVHESTGAGVVNNEDFIDIRIIVDPQLLPEFWQEISMTLKDIVRHEIEHLTHQGGGFTANPAKIMRGDTARRDKIKLGQLPVNQYFKLKKEIDANLQGLLFRAKKEKKPFADVVNTYLDAQKITPKEKEEILTLWRKRLPALGIRQTL